MKIGEVCLETNDVGKMAEFYKWLLNISDDNTDSIHQTLISEETMLTIYNDGSKKDNNNRNISLAFTVNDIYAYHERLVEKHIEIIEGPTVRPWGIINMSFHDPDNNVIYLRQFP
jgi:predicted enzyme related to lactoylglutathione lyase